MTYMYVNMNVVFLFVYRLVFSLSSTECEKLQPSTGICLTQYCVQSCQVLHSLCLIR